MNLLLYFKLRYNYLTGKNQSYSLEIIFGTLLTHITISPFLFLIVKNYTFIFFIIIIILNNSF